MNFDKFIQNYCSNFKLKYNWTKTYSPIGEYLKFIMTNTFNIVINDYLQNNKTNSKQDNVKKGKLIKELPNLIHDLEDFFYAGIATGLFNEQNINHILMELKKNCQFIEYLPPKLDNKVYGRTDPSRHSVQIRSGSYDEYAGLTKEEVRKMYLFHELGHTILRIRNHSIMGDYYLNFEKVMKAKDKDKLVKKTSTPQLLYAGLFMMEECLVQEMAEKFIFLVTKKKRPSYRKTIDLGEIIETNLAYYGIFQMPMINLGRTLKGCGNQTSNEKILESMLKRALEHDFVIDLISEYDAKKGGSADAYEDLMQIIINMGIICDKKYKEFHQSLVTSNYTGNVSEALKDIDIRCKKNIENERYPSAGFVPIDFNNPHVQSSFFRLWDKYGDNSRRGRF